MHDCHNIPNVLGGNRLRGIAWGGGGGLLLNILIRNAKKFVGN